MFPHRPQLVRSLTGIAGETNGTISPDSSSDYATDDSATTPSRCVFFSTREEPVIYISGRPFVLRDASDPTEALHLADRAETLEGIEDRLKADILAEANKFGGLLLTHYEEGEDAGLIAAVRCLNKKVCRRCWNHRPILDGGGRQQRAHL